MQHFRNLNPYERHKLIINEYVLNQPGRTKLLKRDLTRGKTDIDVIRENHKFLWDEDDVAETWEEQLARKYYDKLFKEYCISDLSKYKENKVALRWRVEKEVVSGKGQFICGNKSCSEENGLRSWEVNFAYMEAGEKKNALVKLRLCPNCSNKLNYHSKKREVKRIKKQLKKKKKHSIKDQDSSDEQNYADTLNAGTSHAENHPSEECSTMDFGSEQIEESDNEAELNNIDTRKEKDQEIDDHWRKQPTEVEEPTREEEFERYLEDLLL